METPFSMYQVGAEALLPPRDISVSQWADENVGAHRIWFGGTGPVAHQTLPAGTDGRPQPVASVQAGGVDVCCPDVEDLDHGELPGLHRGRGSGPDAGGGTPIGRCQSAFQGSRRTIVPALASTPRENSPRSSRAIRTTRRCTRCLPTVPGISPSLAPSRRPGWPCVRSGICCWTRLTGTPRAPDRRAIRYRWRCSAPGSFEHNKKVIMCSTPTVGR